MTPGEAFLVSTHMTGLLTAGATEVNIKIDESGDPIRVSIAARMPLEPTLASVTFQIITTPEENPDA